MANSVEFMINIQQKMSGDNAVTELQRLEAQIKSEEGALKNLEAWMKRLQKGNSIDIAQHRQVSGLIEQKQGKLAGLFGQLAAVHEAGENVNETNEVMGAGTKATGGLMEKLSGKLGRLGGALHKLGGPLGESGGGVLRMGGAFQRLAAIGPAGIAVAVAVAVVALAAGLVIAGVGLAKFALASANARRDSELSLEAIVGQGAAARALASDMKRIEGATGVAASRQLELVRQLKDAKVPSEQMGRALRALSTAEAAGAPEAVEKFITQVKGGSASVEKLSRDIDSKFGAIAAKRMLGLDQQSAKFSRDLAGLFDGVDSEPFLKGLHEMGSFFDENTASGRALHYIITSIFQPILDSAGVVFPIVKKFMQGMLIAALHLYIAVKPVARAVADFFALKPGDGTRAALIAGEVAFYSIAAAAVITAGLIFFALAPLAILIAGITVAALILGVVLFTPFVIAGAAIYGLYAAFVALWGYLKGIDWGSVATNLINGLVDGITAGIGRVVSAVKSLGKSMLGAIDSTLEIHSPSRAFHRRGLFSAEGTAGGVEDGTPGVAEAVSSMVAIPDEAAGGKRPASGGGGRASASFEGATFNFYGVKDAEQASGMFESVLTRLLEGKALSLGAELEPA